MARSFNKGRFSEEFYNNSLYELHKIIEHINDMPEDPNIGPYTDKNGALWLDRTDKGGELKYNENGVWTPLFYEKFRLICEILSDTEPINPVTGQLWINNGILYYYSGYDWIPAKAANIETNFNFSAFEHFLIISPIEASGKKVIKNEVDMSTLNRETIVQNQIVSGSAIKKYEIQQGEYEVGSNSLQVFVNGKKLPASFVKQNNSIEVEIINLFEEDKNLEQYNVDIVYINNGISICIDETYSQVLLPNEYLDKVFLNGLINTEYTKVSDISIEYPTNFLTDKTLSVTHVNPKRLIDIQKIFFNVDKTSRFLPISETSVELYGIKNGVGTLLLESEKDYKITSTGINLLDKTLDNYDIIQAVIYKFDNNSSSFGSLVKKEVDLSTESSIYIGYIDEPDNLAIFTSGLFLEQITNGNKNYYYDNEYIYIDTRDKVDLDVIYWTKKEDGFYTPESSETKCKIKPKKTYNHPLFFVNGLNFSEGTSPITLVDYTIEMDSNGEITYVIEKPMDNQSFAYAIVETLTYDENNEVEENMILKNEICVADERNECYIDLSEYTDEEISAFNNHIILFINGLLISKSDINFDINNKRIIIKSNNIEKDMEYTLLYDKFDRHIFSNTLSFNSIVLKEKADSILVFIQGYYIGEVNSLYCYDLPSTGKVNEIKQLISTDDLYIYKNEQWNLVEDDAKKETLKACCEGFYFDNYTVTFFKNHSQDKCLYYAYKYANAVEKTLKRGMIYTKKGQETFYIPFSHMYTPTKNNLFIWQNGLRQYPNTSTDLNNLNGYLELASNKFKIADTMDGTLVYIVEPLEKGELKACESYIVKKEDILESKNHLTIKTNLDLRTNNVRVYISGIRQPKETYQIVDNHTIMFYYSCAIGDNFPEQFILHNEKLINLILEHPDSVLIETRPDNTLQEITIPIRYPKQKVFSIKKRNEEDVTLGGDELPNSLFYSTDLIVIYINGLIYSGEYYIDEIKGTITLLDETTTNLLGVDPINEYFNENPDAKQRWIEHYGEYIPKNNDIITFEWR